MKKFRIILGLEAKKDVRNISEDYDEKQEGLKDKFDEHLIFPRRCSCLTSDTFF